MEARGSLRPPGEVGAAERFFWRISAHPGRALAGSLAILAAAAAFVPQLSKDTRNLAYVRPDHPAVAAQDRLEDQFGLGDPILVIVVAHGPNGIFEPEILQYVYRLSEEIQSVPGVDSERVRSLSTTNAFHGEDDVLVVEPLLDDPPAGSEGAARLRRETLSFELAVGSLVSRDGRATQIVAELLDPKFGTSAYERIRELAATPPGDQVEVHVAGSGAYNALIGDYIDADMRRLNPIAALLIVAMLALAYRTLRGVMLPLVAVVAALTVSFGAMAACGVPMYGITQSMSVILIAIGVCDGVHILAEYYEGIREQPEASGRAQSVRAVSRIWRPVLVTSVTSMGGFLALALSTDMPPMRWYGIFASLGVAAALLASVITIPAFLAMLPPKPSPVFSSRPQDAGRTALLAGRAIARHPARFLLAGAAAVAAGGFGLARLQRDNDSSAYLDTSEPLYRAEVAVNETLGGMWTLDVVVEGEEEGTLYEPEVLRRMAELQRFLEAQPRVKEAKSLVDYVRQMHQAMNGGSTEFYAIPDDRRLIAQYFLVYSASGDPTDFEEVVDYDFRIANVRAAFEGVRWSDSRWLVPAVQEHLRSQFDLPGVEASLAGWLNIGYYLDREVGSSQLRGIALAFTAIFLISAASFRSLGAGFFAFLPVAFAVLLVYGVMGLYGIWLNLGTSMTASIAIGLSVDFAVYVIDRLSTRARNVGMERALVDLFGTTGRALLFNFAAVAAGFTVLVSSKVPTLREFGVLVAVCITSAFLASLTLLPALVAVVRPRWLGSQPSNALPGIEPVASPRRLEP